MKTSDLRLLIIDALTEFYRRREPVDEYMEKRYGGERGDYFKDAKRVAVEERVDMARLLCTKLDEITEAVEAVLNEPEEVTHPCPHCYRENDDGTWFTPCPSDDCPSRDEVDHG